MRPDLFLATIGRGSNGSNALEVTEDRAAVTAESQDNIINRVNNISQYGPSWHYVPGIGVAGTAYAEVPGSALGDLAFSRASSKTRTNSAGVVETIGNNVPPHDYRNADGTLSTFPRLNLEPQRTNSATKSDDFNGWSTKVNVTTTANYAVSPDGSQNADRLQFTGAGYLTSTPGFSQTSGTVYTVSCYAKRNGSGTESIGFFVNGSTVVNSAWTLTNEWQRLTYTYTASNAFLIGIAGANNADVSIFGFQIEVGSYATSYIPTTTAAVTRLADTASKTGVSSLIGQTEGTLFAEINYRALSEGRRILGISDGTTSNRIVIATEAANIFRFITSTAGVLQIINSSTVTSGNYKLAIGYKNNDFVFYVNGAQIGALTSVNVPACSDIYLGKLETSTVSTILSDQVAQAALFKTRLPNATLAQLTTL